MAAREGFYCIIYYLEILSIFRLIFINKNDCILIPMSLKFVPGGPINIAVLVVVVAFHQTDARPSSEPTVDYFSDTYSRTPS